MVIHLRQSLEWTLHQRMAEAVRKTQGKSGIGAFIVDRNSGQRLLSVTAGGLSFRG
ncbi:MAG: hypothetical protein JST01_08005 [Cyanobacteria bacterium SZAS TMP-1]|nr:hypothetical protein [Cyanobacteria bacterium SZAS TMP-1]